MNNNVIFIMMVGISASGKTTKALKLKEEYNANYISSDDTRIKLFDDVNEQNYNSKVFKHMEQNTMRYLKNGYSVIYDSTALKIKDRKHILEKVKRLNIKTVACVMTTPFDICLQRNEQRDRTVPKYVIENQRSKFQIPFVGEFDEVILDGWKDYDFNKDSATLKQNKFQTIVDSMEGFDQNTHWHKYTLEKHCNLCNVTINKIPFLYGENVVHNLSALSKAAQIHDYAKRYSYQVKENGEYSFHGHANIGTYDLLQNLDCLNADNYKEALDILFYINYHMLAHDFKTNKICNKWKNIFEFDRFNDLIIIQYCDRIASGTDENAEQELDGFIKNNILTKEQ